jgi:hypothetical protein
MYEKDGQRYFIADGHVHFWDGRPCNQANRYGEGFIDCLYHYHRNLSPEYEVWSLEDFWQQSEERIPHDLFEVGHVDKTIFQPAYLTDFTSTKDQRSTR